MRADFGRKSSVPRRLLPPGLWFSLSSFRVGRQDLDQTVPGIFGGGAGGVSASAGQAGCQTGVSPGSARSAL